MGECPNCGAADAPEDGIVVGALGDGSSSCTICRADELYQRTVLSKQESKVAAHKQITGAPHATIAERTELSKSTVDEYSRRMKDKVKKSKVTVNELDRFL